MRKSTSITLNLLAGTTLLILSVLPSQAQWLTQTNVLREGWNSVYLHVDASDTLLETLMEDPAANPIQEIWLWQPPGSTLLFSGAPGEAVSDGTQWILWRRLDPSSTLSKLVGNAAYLVRVTEASGPFEWAVKGRPLAPNYNWTVTGLNFVGFPILPQTPPVSFADFLQPAPLLRQLSDIYHYPAGQPNTSPLLLMGDRDYNDVAVQRQQAYWVDTTNYYNNYFGPFQIVPPTPSGIKLGDKLSQATCRLRNLTPSDLTVTLQQIPSEPSEPPGPLNVTPVLVRGSLNTTNLTYDYTSLENSATTSWVLTPQGQPGSEIDIVLGVDRTEMTGAPGQPYAGILRFTDSLNLSQVDFGISAEVASTAGLWVGNASVTGVEPYLRRYTIVTNQQSFDNRVASLDPNYSYEWDTNSHRILVYGGDEGYVKAGAYLTEDSTVSSSTVARPFPLRLIVHRNDSSTRLLRQVFHGLGNGGSNHVVSTTQNVLHAPALASARRITAAHLPVGLSPDDPGVLSPGDLRPGNDLTFHVALNYDDQPSNPFLHTYHPDHDNLDALYKEERPQGAESYKVQRVITLRFTQPGNDFSSRTTGPRILNGAYYENVTFSGQKRVSSQGIDLGTDSRSYSVSGIFALQRISDIAELVP